MNILITKLIKGEKITDNDIQEELYEICCDVHVSCVFECPVYEKNKDIPWLKGKWNCSCFKDGKKMLSFLRK
jgi:hypothetical protein